MSPTATPSASLDPNAEWQPTTAWEKTLARIGPDGSVDLDTALTAFSLAIAPLPGVTVPENPDDDIDDGSEAVRWIQEHWDELSDAQRTEAQRHLIPAGQPGAQGTAPSSRSLGIAAAVQVVPVHVLAPLAAVRDRPVQATLDTVIETIGRHLGRTLSIPPPDLTINPTNENIRGKPALAYTVLADADGQYVGAPASCHIWMNPRGVAQDDVAFTATVAHEAFHCFQGAIQPSLKDYKVTKKLNPWVVEGQAEWVGEAVANELAGSTSSKGAKWWRPYLLAPRFPLLRRTYDAIGFYARLDERGQDPWLIFDEMLKTAGGVDAYHRATDGIGEAFSDSWASGFFRDAAPGRDWNIEKGVALPAGVHPKPTAITLVNGGKLVPVNVAPYANAILVVGGPAEVARFEIVGRARLSDQVGYPVVGLEGRDFCLKDPCECPPKMHFTIEPPGFLTPQLKVAVSGGTDGATGYIKGIALLDLCEPDETPVPSRAGDRGDRPPCRARCAMSNGDPHLVTVDGRAYDFQAAGEFTALRSDDGSVDVQVRQEPYEAKTTVSINTAVALRANGRRIGITIGSTGTIDARIDRAPLIDTSVDLGGGASVVRHQSGVEVALADGSSVWALSLGAYGINLVIAPGTGLRETGKGILGRTPPGGAGLPSLPDGTSLPRLDDSHARFVQLYGAFADAWRVTDGTSLFDYAPGTSTATYTKPGFPSEADTVAQNNIPLESVPGATEACAPVTDPYLRAQCVFDVAVTNNLAYANQYVLTQHFMKQGSKALIASVVTPGPAPLPTQPATPPQATEPPGSPPIEVLPVLHNLAGSALAPDGTLYSSAVMADRTGRLFALDPVSGAILRQADAAGAGEVAIAAGSVWVGEFAAPFTGNGSCSVTRLDPGTLAVQATVPTACHGLGRTHLAALGDDVWYVDPSGTDASGAGSMLRRIDTTNQVTGSVPIPFPDGLLRASATALFYGESTKGQFRLRPGETALTRIGKPDTNALAYNWPAGDGLWSVVDDRYGLYASAKGPDRYLDLEVGGSLVAADADSVYFERAGTAGGRRELWRQYLDGRPSIRLAVAAPADSGIGAMPLNYFDVTTVPTFLVGEASVAKLWTLVSRSDPAESMLLVQGVRLPAP